MAPFLPSGLYSAASVQLGAAAAAQRQQEAMARTVVESSLKAPVVAAAPAEKKIAMYSKARGAGRGRCTLSPGARPPAAAPPPPRPGGAAMRERARPAPGQAQGFAAALLR